jgi:hypothetical protein
MLVVAVAVVAVVILGKCEGSINQSRRVKLHVLAPQP